MTLSLYLARKLPRRLREAHTNHWRIAWGMLSVGVFVLAAKLVAAAKEMAVAWRYGVSGEVDAYLLAFTITTWLPVILWSVGTVVLVPRLVALADKSMERSRFIAELNGTVLLLGLMMTLLAVFLGPWFVGLIAGGLEEATQGLARTMVWQLAPLALLTVMAGFLSIRLQARERHGYTFLEAMPALGILAFVLLAPSGLDTAPLIWGTLVGAVVQATWLARMTQRADGGVGGIAVIHRSPHWQSGYSAVGLMTMGQLIMGFTTPIDQIFAAQVGEGAIATLGYANRIIALATGLGAVAVGRALLPVLSDAAAKGEYNLGRTQALRWAWLMLGVSSLAVFFGWALAPWGVSLLFERGAFSADDTATVAHVLRFGLLQLPFYFAGIVLVQWLAATKRLKFIFWTAVINVPTKLIVVLALTPILGLAGVVLSTVAMYAASLLACYFFVKKLNIEK